MWKKAPNALQLTRLQASFFAHCSSYHWLARLFTFSTNRSLAGEWKVCCPNYESNYDYKFKNYDFKEIDATVPRHCAASLCCTTVQRQCAALLCCVTALRYCAKPLCRVMKSRIGKWFMKWKFLMLTSCLLMVGSTPVCPLPPPPHLEDLGLEQVDLSGLTQQR